MIDWAALGKVVLYSFAVAGALTYVFTTGVLLIEGSRAPVRRVAGALCFALCAALVAFGLYVMFSSK